MIQLQSIENLGHDHRWELMEGLPAVLGNEGTVAKYWGEQRKMSLFYGTGEQKFTNERIETRYLSKFIKGEQIRKNMREHGNMGTYMAILEGNKEARTPPGRPSLLGAMKGESRSRGKAEKELFCYWRWWSQILIAIIFKVCLSFR